MRDKLKHVKTLDKLQFDKPDLSADIIVPMLIVRVEWQNFEL